MLSQAMWYSIDYKTPFGSLQSTPTITCVLTCRTHTSSQGIDIVRFEAHTLMVLFSPKVDNIYIIGVGSYNNKSNLLVVKCLVTGMYQQNYLIIFANDSKQNIFFFLYNNNLHSKMLLELRWICNHCGKYTEI